MRPGNIKENLTALLTHTVCTEHPQACVTLCWKYKEDYFILQIYIKIHELQYSFHVSHVIIMYYECNN